MEISVGAIVEGTIKSITKFGAFVALPGGRSGLVHISEIAYSYVTDVNDFLSEGETVKVKVVGIDEAGRINLSIKKALPPPARPQNSGRPPRDRDSGGRNSNAGGQERQEYRGSRNSGNSGNGSRGNSNRYQPREAVQNAGPADFEARLKQFMQASDSKLSDLKMTEKRSSRRGGHR